LRAHALGTSTDSNINHTTLDRIGNVYTCLETAGALAIERPDGCGDGESSCDGSGTKFSGTTAWGKHAADSNVLNEVGVDAGAVDEGFEGADEEVGGLGVFETAFAAFGEGSAESAGHYDIIRMLLQQSVPGARLAQMGADLGKPFLSLRSSAGLICHGEEM
jgi:hypothetical protein